MVGDESPIMPTPPIGGIIGSGKYSNNSRAQASVDGNSYLICIQKTIS